MLLSKYVGDYLYIYSCIYVCNSHYISYVDSVGFTYVTYYSLVAYIILIIQHITHKHITHNIHNYTYDTYYSHEIYVSVILYTTFYFYVVKFGVIFFLTQGLCSPGYPGNHFGSQRNPYVSRKPCEHALVAYA